ncbi:pH-response regulator protein palA/prr-1 [Zalerion maritima]|uniref:PH-response regulator protein palA/prr-1 n=1 Tax=Zalerion maritima TaxID=339359 RepID=A0AAD5WMP4_9PEZI|nr:pH-response regulator protein palA/prr-1 [Zalerion maritima]
MLKPLVQILTRSSNILSLPFRKATHLSFKNAVKQYISEKYDQHPDMFRADLDVIDSLRREAVNVREAHPSGVPKLLAYAAQLVWMGTKFPIDIGCDFSWYPALGYHTDRPVIRNNLKFELINVLFNLAALHAQLAVSSNRGSSEGLKAAANNFMSAAGILTHIKTNIVPDLRTDPPDDMDDHSLDSLTHLFLAQAQECFWHKAVNDNYKDVLISKLACQVSDFYASAGDEAVQSSAISSSWIHHMTAKHHHFAAAGQYRAARDCLEKRKYGEEVARLRDAVACVREGLKEGKGGYVSPLVLRDLEKLEEKTKEDLKRAEKDNDLIYLQLVPEKPELGILARAKMADLRCPSEVSNPIEHLGENTQFGPGLFSKLVPFAVHVAVSLYEESRNTYVETKIVRELEALDEQLRQDLASLNLPASFQALEKPLGVPPAVREYNDTMKNETPMETIPATFEQRNEMRRNCLGIFNSLYEMLRAEDNEDSRLRERYGTLRWARPPSTEDIAGKKHWDNVNSVQRYIELTEGSDATVTKTFENSKGIIQLLSGPLQYVIDFVPSSRRTEVPPTMVPVLGRLRNAYSDVLRLQSQRRKRIESVRARAKNDDIRADILKEASRLERQYPSCTITAADFDGFFDKRITSFYGEDLQSLDREQERQDQLMDEVGRLNREFEAQKRRMGGGENALGGQERQDKLQELENGYNVYCKIKKDTAAGMKFYNDLMRQVDQLSSKAIPWVEGRRKEARDLEAELNIPHLTSLSISNPGTPNQGPNQYFPSSTQQPTATPQQQQQARQQQQLQQQAQKHQAAAQRISNRMTTAAFAGPPASPPQEPQLQSWASQTVVPQQPRPMTRWTPDMGIKFGTPGPGTANTAASVAGGAGGGGQMEGVVMGGGQQIPNGGGVDGKGSASPGKKHQQSVQGAWDQSKPLRFG